jgi:hypothetical protein
MRITSELAQEVLDGMEEAAKLFSSQPAEASSNEARQQSIQVLKPMADKLKGDSGKGTYIAAADCLDCAVPAV